MALLLSAGYALAQGTANTMTSGRPFMSELVLPSKGGCKMKYADLSPVQTLMPWDNSKCGESSDAV